MFSEIRYDNLINQVDSVFPEFPTYLGDTRQIIEDLKGSYLTFLGVYVRENWSELALQAKLAAFINAMEASKKGTLELVYDDFLLDFYLDCEEHDIQLDTFLNQLSHPAKERMLYNYNFWIEANNKAKDGSR